MEAPFTVHLLGPVEIRCNGIPIRSLRSRHALWLLVLLVLREGKEVDRRWLAETLWPDSDLDALACLRPNLTDVRHALGDQAFRLVSPNRRTLKLNLNDADVDVLAFDRAIVKGDAASLKTAVELYHGPLVEDCSEFWMLSERQRRERQILKALSQLAKLAEEEGEDEAAIQHLQKAISFDPVGQEAYRSLMLCYERAGAYQAALDVYHNLNEHLRKHGGEIDPATLALVQHIRQSQKNKQGIVTERQETFLRATRPVCHVPQNLTEIIGRDEQIVRVEASLITARLVTLTGPGGVGKTRLACHVAEQVVDYYADGAWFVSLETVTDPHRVAEQVGKVLGVLEPQNASWLEPIVEFLQSRRLLLILDNCEHLVEACSRLVKTLLGKCRHVCILATSHSRLGVEGEVVWRVPSLRFPADDVLLFPQVLQDYPAICLFVQRASEVRPSFRLTEQNASVIARLCRRLDGLPLALGLAAGLMESLSETDISARLDDRFGLLVGMDLTETERHQSLRAVMDWSHDLLLEREHALLHRLCVFVGGWTLDAASAVCRGKELLRKDIALLLHRLHSKSLVEAHEWNGQKRYRLLEMVRQYGLDRWQDTEDQQRTACQHAAFYVRFARSVEPHLTGAEQTAWLNRLEREHENLKAALRWCLSTPRKAKSALRLAGYLWRFWYAHHADAEVQGWLQQTLEATQELRSKLRQKVLRAAGNIAYVRGQLPIAHRYFIESLELAQELDDAVGSAAALGSLGNVANGEEDFVCAWEMFSKCLTQFQALNDQSGEAATLANLAITACNLKRYEQARSLHEQSLSMFQEQNDLQNVALGWNNMTATVLQTEERRDIGKLLLEGSSRSLSLKNWRYVVHSLANYLTFAMSRDAVTLAATLLGAMDGIRDRFHISASEKILKENRKQREVIKKKLGVAEFAVAYQQGSAISPEESVRYAQAEAARWEEEPEKQVETPT